MSSYNNYEQILAEWLSEFVDEDADHNPLVYRDVPPTQEEIEEFGDKVYCVYTVFEGDFGQQVTQPVSIFSYGNRAKVFAKKELLSTAIQNGAEVVVGDNIVVKFTSGDPFIQDRTDEDPNIKGYSVNFLATVYRYTN